MNFPQIQRPARVLMTVDTVGGVWTYAMELIRAFADQDVTVGLASMGALLNREQRQQIRQLPNVELFESRFKLEWMNDPWADVARASNWLVQLEQQFHPQVVHLNSYVFGMLPWCAPRIVVGHSCVLSWWRAVKGRAAPAEWDQYRLLVGHGLRMADMVVAPSFAMLAALEQHYPPLPPAEVIPNGREADLFLPGPKGRYILSAGRLWDEAKNVRALAEVAPELPWPVYVAGDENPPNNGPRTSGKAAVQGGNGSGRLTEVCRLGRLTTEQLARWYAAAAIYVLPARYEPFGLSALEAGLAECALVLGDISSLREIWDGAAVFVTPDDRQILRSVLMELISKPKWRSELGRKARQRALEFTPGRMAAAYLSLYSDVTMLQVPNAAELIKELA